MILFKLNKEEEYKIEEIYNLINKSSNSLTIMLFVIVIAAVIITAFLTINYLYQERSVKFRVSLFSFIFVSCFTSAYFINELIYSEKEKFTISELKMLADEMEENGYESLLIIREDDKSVKYRDNGKTYYYKK